MVHVPCLPLALLVHIAVSEAQTIIAPTYYTETNGALYEPSTTNDGATVNLKKSVQGVQYIPCPAGTVVTGSFSLFDVGKEQSSPNWGDCTSAMANASPTYQSNPSSQYCGIQSSSARECSYSFVQIFTNKGGGYIGGAVPMTDSS